MCLDTELIASARRGDDKALMSLAQRYMAFAHEKAKGFVSSPIEYDDIVQEAMLGFISAYCTFELDGKASFKTYVSVCMDNRIRSAITSLERKKRIPREAIVGLEDIADEYSQDEPEEVFFRRRKAEEVVRRIKEELSDNEKRVLSLFISGMKYEEIASELGVTVKSVDGALQRIRKKLKEAR